MTIPPEEQRGKGGGHGGRGSWGRGFGGGYLDERVVRGIIFARLTNFVAGNSKARPVVAERLAALLDGPLPEVPLDGEVGAGEVLPMAHVLAGLDRSDLEEGEANPLSNGSPCSAALAADAALQAGHRLAHAEQVLALSLEAFRAPLEAYDEIFEALLSDIGDIAAMRAIRGHLAGAPAGGRRGEVPLSYRFLCPVLGRVHRAVAALEDAARVSLRSVTDNPVYLPPDADHRLGRALSTGGFHNAVAYPALTALTGAWADLALTIERHVTALDTPELSGLPPATMLGFRRVVSGFVEEARAVAMPTLLPAAVNDAQDDISSPIFGAYRRQGRAADCIDSLLAMLAAEASQALFNTSRPAPPALEGVLEDLRAIFPPVEGRAGHRLGGEAAGLVAALGRSAVSGSSAFSTLTVTLRRAPRDRSRAPDRRPGYLAG